MTGDRAAWSPSRFRGSEMDEPRLMLHRLLESRAPSLEVHALRRRGHGPEAPPDGELVRLELAPGAGMPAVPCRNALECQRVDGRGCDNALVRH